AQDAAEGGEALVVDVAGDELEQGLAAAAEGGVVGQRHPLVREGRAGEPPAVAGFAHEQVVRDEHAVQEHLVEQGVAGQLAEGPDVQALRLHVQQKVGQDRKSTRLNSSHVKISYAVF